MSTNWSDKLDDFGRELLERLGVGPYYLPTDSNPITDALNDDPYFVDTFKDMEGFSKIALSRVAVACQMVVYDSQRGPDGDGERKGLRRQWYAWYKTRFAIPFSNQLANLSGDDRDLIEARGFDGTLWAGRMSQTYSYFVDELGVTYWDLWVTDSSRMMEQVWGRLVEGLNIVLAVEKDSLFGDFKTVAKGIGAQALISGKGKQSKAATEKMLRDIFDIQYGDPFSYDNPLIVLHISDHDMDGEAVIGPTFGEQCRRYTPHVVEARVGIKPEVFLNERGGHYFDEEAVRGSWYEVKTTNKGYLDWAATHALFEAECPACGNKWIVQGLTDGSWSHTCPACFASTGLAIKVDLGEFKEIGGQRVRRSPKERHIIQNQPFGFEVEAIPTRRYYRLVVEALLSVVEWDWLIDRLRDECVADYRSVANTITRDVLESNEDYQKLLEEFARLEGIKNAFEESIKRELEELGEPLIEDWRDEEDDPEPEDFEDYVAKMGNWDGVWRPFSSRVRTDKLEEHLREQEAERIQELMDKPLEW